MRLAEPVQVRARLAAEVEHVLEPGRPDERRPRSAPLEEGVGRDCRSVGEAVDRLRPDRCPGARVVMLTGRSGRSEEEGSGEAGAIGYLRKDELSSPRLADSLIALVELS